MTVAGSWFHALSVLLALAGLAKIRRPDSILDSLRILRLPAHRTVAIAVGILETVIGVGGVAVGSRPAVAAVVGAYLALTMAAILLVRADAVADCGCFGAARSPMNRTHVMVDVAFTVGAAVSLFEAPGSLLSAVSSQAWSGVPYLLLVAALAVSGFLLFTALPALHGAAARLQVPAVGAFHEAGIAGRLTDRPDRP